VRKRFPDGTDALRGVTLSVRQGEIAAVIGPSGAGKSTLLRCINGLVYPTGGAVSTLGFDVRRGMKGARRLRRQVGMVFQSFNLIPRLTVLHNVLLGRLGFKGVLPSMVFHFTGVERERALAALDRVGIGEQAWKPAGQLSGGQMQRVAIARTLMQDPPLILADEPVSNLDPVIAKSVLQHLVTICREDKRTVLLNLHAVELVKMVAERVIGMREGVIVYDGELAGLTIDVLKRIYGEEYTD
jgi:phosphonate transport system ATP-binding protein